MTEPPWIPVAPMTVTILDMLSMGDGICCMDGISKYDIDC